MVRVSSPPQSRSKAVVCVSTPRMYPRSGYFLVNKKVKRISYENGLLCSNFKDFCHCNILCTTWNLSLTIKFWSLLSLIRIKIFAKENNLSHPTNIISESMRKLQYKFPRNSWSHFLLADPIML